jgi:hypothetical protein
MASLRPVGSRWIRVFLIIGFMLHLAWYAVVYRALITTSAINETDYRVFYTAGRIADGDYGQVYDRELQREVQSQAVAGGRQLENILLFNRPPYMLPLLQIVTDQDFVGSFLRWTVVLILLYCAGALMTLKMLLARGVDRTAAVVTSLSSLLFFPAFISLLQGQETALLLLGVTTWMYALTLRRDHVAGLGLALTTIKPHITLLLAIPFLFKRRKVWAGFCVGAALLLLYSYVLIGARGFADFVDSMMVSAGGSAYGLNEAGMVNLLGLSLRLFPTLDGSLIRGAAWLFYALSIAGLGYLWHASSDVEWRHVSTAVLLAVLAVPHLHSHDLALLIVPTVALALAYNPPGQVDPLRLPAFVTLVSLILLFSFGSPAKDVAIYGLVVALGVGLWHRRGQPTIPGTHVAPLVRSGQGEVPGTAGGQGSTR